MNVILRIQLDCRCVFFVHMSRNVTRYFEKKCHKYIIYRLVFSTKEVTVTITNQQTKHHFHPIPHKNCALACLTLRTKQHWVWIRASKLQKQGPNKSFSNERMQQNHCFIPLVSYLLWLKHKETVYVHSCRWFRLKGYTNTTATAMGAFTTLFKTTLKFKSRLHNYVFRRRQS